MSDAELIQKVNENILILNKLKTDTELLKAKSQQFEARLEARFAMIEKMLNIKNEK